ncbi:hypothetical protein H2508_04225 [Parahaliea sp. F7430]|uniref:HTH luxR-type domain-containing protein n=1 Tax=Sediminihaliea albiluteola TaxID=2758564 RepID=A0A7W2YIA7_9GAMM|nr:LuxR C-terminal-related transcriptional regulator [Sediminihaliea albiluteola]MBA6412311.1 hypothetical protein [Sediminihaliea albiluteola]
MAAALVLYPNTESSVEIHVISSDEQYDIDWAAVNRRYINTYLDLDPTSCLMTAPGDLKTIDEHKDTAYYQEFLQPLGVEYALRMGFAAAGRNCWISACKTRAQGNFSSAAKAKLQALIPHLEVSLENYATVMLSSSERFLYNTALQNMNFGSFVLDADGKILSCNTVAEHLTQRYSEIAVENGKLAINSNVVNETLQSLLSLSRKNSATDERESRVIRIDCGAGGSIGILLKPVSRDKYFTGFAAPAVVIYLSDLARLQLASHEETFDNQKMISALFGLTAAEAKLTLLLADGLTLAGAGRMLSIAEKTARNHLAHIFEKTGVNRQVDLIRLVYRSVAVMGG